MLALGSEYTHMSYEAWPLPSGLQSCTGNKGWEKCAKMNFPDHKLQRRWGRPPHVAQAETEEQRTVKEGGRVKGLPERGGSHCSQQPFPLGSNCSFNALLARGSKHWGLKALRRAGSAFPVGLQSSLPALSPTWVSYRLCGTSALSQHLISLVSVSNYSLVLTLQAENPSETQTPNPLPRQVVKGIAWKMSGRSGRSWEKDKAEG